MYIFNRKGWEENKNDINYKPPMQAEIISNGDELTSGKILDTNSQWLSRELADLGVSTLYHTTVGDDLQAMVAVLRIAAQRADLILWTGGLGPTADDLTRQAIAEMLEVPLERNEESLRQIKEMFQRRGRPMPPINEIQAFQPKGAVPILNPHGTAPGIDCTVPRRGEVQQDRLDFFRIMAFPGVPAEMKEMWNGSGRALLQTMLDRMSDQKRVLRFRSIHSFGLGESQIETMLPGVVDRKHFPLVGITATQGTITLRIAAEAESEEECFKIMEPTARLIYETLGDLIYGEDEDTLQKVVCRLLTERKKTLAVVESGTRGLLAEALASADQSGKCFVGGIILPPQQIIAAEEMVQREKSLFDTDYILLVGPYPASPPDKQWSEETFVAVVDTRQSASKGEMIAYEVYPYVGHPSIIDDLHIKRALNLLRNFLTIFCFVFLYIAIGPMGISAENEKEELERAVAAVSPWLVRIDTIGGHEKVGDEFANEGTSTGVLLDTEGFVLTSAFHFLHEPASILLRFFDGSKKVARKVAVDRSRMLTLLKVERLNLDVFPPFPEYRTKNSVRVGEPCLGVGVALSQEEPNLAVGVVSGKDRIWGKAIQTDAAIGPNNYGGPIVDLRGRWIGLAVPLSMTSDEITAGAELYDAGVGLAIPFEDIFLKILPKLKTGTDIIPGTLGIGLRENRIFIGEAVLDFVRPGLPAAEAGLDAGDRIVALDDLPIRSALELSMKLHQRDAGETVHVSFVRNQKEKTVTLTTVARSAEETE